MAWQRDRNEYRLMYRHGVQPAWRFVSSETGERDGVPAHVRGTVIHDVLERIRDEEELAELLDVAIGTLDHPELEERLASGGAYRRQLEEEIRRVVTGPEWQWYVEGAHHRELWFVHFATPAKWRVGAFDLVRRHENGLLIVDFKTHEISAKDAAAKAAGYTLQAAVYRRAAAVTGWPVRFRLHFTHPNVAVEM
jgi:ATP-dependent exoDNAse (exonuclease V) beta subunit